MSHLQRKVPRTGGGDAIENLIIVALVLLLAVGFAFRVANLGAIGLFGRTDLNSQAISAPDFQLEEISGPAYVIVQRGRTYFENRDEITWVRNNLTNFYEVRANGIVAAEVFSNQKQFENWVQV